MERVSGFAKLKALSAVLSPQPELEHVGSTGSTGQVRVRLFTGQTEMVGFSTTMRVADFKRKVQLSFVKLSRLQKLQVTNARDDRYKIHHSRLTRENSDSYSTEESWTVRERWAAKTSRREAPFSS